MKYKHFLLGFLFALSIMLPSCVENNRPSRSVETVKEETITLTDLVESYKFAAEQYYHYSPDAYQLVLSDDERLDKKFKKFKEQNPNFDIDGGEGRPLRQAMAEYNNSLEAYLLKMKSSR